MNVEPAKVLAKLLLLLDSDILEVLTPKHNHPPFGNQQRQLVLLIVRQLGELKTGDLRSNSGSELRDFDVWIAQPEKMRLGFVC
jgi:hypothetical protein